MISMHLLILFPTNLNSSLSTTPSPQTSNLPQPLLTKATLVRRSRSEKKGQHTGLVCTTSFNVKFIHVSHVTKCPFSVSPFLSSTSIGWPCAAVRRPRGSCCLLASTSSLLLAPSSWVLRHGASIYRPQLKYGRWSKNKGKEVRRTIFNCCGEKSSVLKLFSKAGCLDVICGLGPWRSPYKLEASHVTYF